MTLTAEIRRDLKQLALASRILAMAGHEDVTQGHLAMRDPQGRGIWMKGRGLGLGEVMGADDFVLLDFDGRLIAGERRPHSEWPIHSEAMLARPEIRFSVHSHAQHATILTALDCELDVLSQAAMRIRGQRVARYEETCALITTREEGRALARALGDAWVLLIRNHGVAFYGETVPELALTGVFLEQAAREFLLARATGLPRKRPSAEEMASIAEVVQGERFHAANWAYLCRALARHEGRQRP